MVESRYFLVVLVVARHLDYTDSTRLLKTMAKHPSDGSKNGDVGHAWIYLKGEVDGKPYYLEGGHSGELGVFQPRYLEGVWDNIVLGAKDPISYLFCPQGDGFFQIGNGNYSPTFAAKIDLSQEQFGHIKQFIESYDFSTFSLTDKQCTHFAVRIAALAGLILKDQCAVSIHQHLHFSGHCIQLWQDPKYGEIQFGSPDVLEKSLMEVVASGKAECALKWYRKQNAKCLKCKARQSFYNLKMFPERLLRFLLWRKCGAS